MGYADTEPHRQSQELRNRHCCYSLMNQTVHRASTPCKDCSSAPSVVLGKGLCDLKLNIPYLITLILM